MTKNDEFDFYPKVNKAPEKLYVNIYDHLTQKGYYAFTNKVTENDIEYVCKDAFVEKAWDWVEDNILSSNQQDKSRSYYEEFRKYMKGE